MALAFAALLGALGLVIWRQSQAMDVLRVLDGVRRERAVVEARWAELVHRVEYLESRDRVVAEARDELGMHVPSGSEIVILSVGAPLPLGEEVR